MIPKSLRETAWSRVCTIKQRFSNLSVNQNHLEGFLKYRLLGSNPSFDSMGLRWSSRICIIHRFSHRLLLLLLLVAQRLNQRTIGTNTMEMDSVIIHIWYQILAPLPSYDILKKSLKLLGYQLPQFYEVQKLPLPPLSPWQPLFLVYILFKARLNIYPQSKSNVYLIKIRI